MTPLEKLEREPNWSITKLDWPRFPKYHYIVVAARFWGISGRGMGETLEQAVERALRILEVRWKRFYDENGATQADLEDLLL